MQPYSVTSSDLGTLGQQHFTVHLTLWDAIETDCLAAKIETRVDQENYELLLAKWHLCRDIDIISCLV